jgi:hypothetical protein
MQGYNTNLAAEFYILSILHRLGANANLTLGNKKSVDIVVVPAPGKAITIDVKGLAGSTAWPVDNLKSPTKNHFIVFVSFKGKIGDLDELPEIYVVPSSEVENCIYYSPGGKRKVVQLGKARQYWLKYKDGWDQIVTNTGA